MNFISDDEEKYILDHVDSNQWVLSQSGRKKQVCHSLNILPF